MLAFDKDRIEGMKILIVDDIPSNLDLLGHILKRKGLEVFIANTVKRLSNLSVGVCLI